MGNSFCYHSAHGHVWQLHIFVYCAYQHSSRVKCKIWSHQFIIIWMITTKNCPWIWIMMETSAVTWTPHEDVIKWKHFPRYWPFGNSQVASEFPTQRQVTRSSDVFFDMRPNKRLSKQSWGWWFETSSRPLWRHCNALDWCHSAVPVTQWYYSLNPFRNG